MQMQMQEKEKEKSAPKKYTVCGNKQKRKEIPLMVDKVHDPVKDVCSNLKKAVLTPTSKKEISL